jgi:hypothetical protein
MRRIIGGALAGLLACNGLTTVAWAGECASPADLAALRTAALQQELMVAAFSCRDIDSYNQFVLTHQPELIASDAKLKSFFVRRDTRHSEASYHAYKTELANASSLRSIRETDAFCAGAESEFRLAVQPVNLSTLIGAQSWGAVASYPACPGDLSLTQTAAVQPLPPRAEPADAHRDRESASDDRPASRRDAARANGSGDLRSERMSTELAAPMPHRKLEADGTL